jgi:hypothetical protein
MLFRSSNPRPGGLVLPVAAVGSLVCAALALGAAGDLNPGFDGDRKLVLTSVSFGSTALPPR